MMLLLLLIVVVATSGQEECRWVVPGSDEEEATTTLSTATLRSALLKPGVYDNNVRPNAALNGSLSAEADEVFFTMFLTSFELDELRQNLAVRGQWRYRWRDARLATEEKIGNCPENFKDDAWRLPAANTLDQRDVWRPRIFATNVEGREIFDGGALPPGENEARRTMIYPDGMVLYTRLIDIVFSCSMEAKKMPYDTQTCFIDLQALSDASSQVIFMSEMNGGVDSSQVRLNVVWRLDNVRVHERRHMREGTEISGLLVEFDFGRRPGYHLTFSMIPAALFLFVAYQGFFIDRQNAPARVTISIIPVLIMRILLNNVYDNLETVSYSIYLGQFLNIAMWVTCLCVFEYSLVQTYLFKEDQAAARRSALKVMAKRLSLRTTTENKSQKKEVQEIIEEPPLESLSDEDEVEKEEDLEKGDDEERKTDDVVKKPRRAFNPSFEHAMSTHDAMKESTRKKKNFLPTRQKSVVNKNEDEYEDTGFNPVFQRDLALLRRVFDRCDADASGYIEPSEVSTLLRDYGVFISKDVAEATILNYYFFNKMPIPKNRKILHLTFEQFVDFLMRYDDYAIGFDDKIFVFHSLPTSLKVDVFCRYAYIPLICVTFLIHYLLWFSF